ncbi:LuxR C-terminal-related transcriptional regulator [Thermoanaerobacterium sp. R66]|uniref:LuxR C-terminal-related transcriptional regulator n=1 Tax=Thermoanaerobacterium sp. R66 TaxID=2742479 RepID=UPI0023806CA3|nr:LuxR C-terminal-related transcriptional regulator [Thermoanaerobacterium sp. R66]MDE4543195.1 LuxR family transcriptional regulator [Thermoanaerobacterium sp. R66]
MAEDIKSNEILFSYKKCLEIGLTKLIVAPLISLEEEELKRKLQENKKLIEVFRKCVNKVRGQWKNRYIFLLVDSEGYLLDVLYNGKIYEKVITDSAIRRGASFKEESCGTNAISLVMKLKQLIYLKAEEHYCDIFKQWYCIAMPLYIDNDTVGYLDISTIKHNMADEMMGFIDLLAYKIVNEYKREMDLKSQEDLEKLTDKQIEIIKRCAKGYTELAISMELGLKLATVKYHKKEIIKKLRVKSFQEAIARAIKLNLID